MLTTCKDEITIHYDELNVYSLRLLTLKQENEKKALKREYENFFNFSYLFGEKEKNFLAFGAG